MIRSALLSAGLAACVLGGARPAVGQDRHLQLKWMRDSEEYATLTRQIYRSALDAVRRQAAALDGNVRWAVVLDVDETVLDNSVYQLELASYGTRFDTTTWNAWARRGVAPSIPGVVAFLDGVRALGGRVAFITNRDDWVREGTVRNLAHLGLFRDDDRLCMQIPGTDYPKSARRREVREGTGRCGWQAEPMHVLAYLGDNMNDFPTTDEDRGEFGDRFFVLPNPAYGSWVTRVTRR